LIRSRAPSAPEKNPEAKPLVDEAITPEPEPEPAERPEVVDVIATPETPARKEKKKKGGKPLPEPKVELPPWPPPEFIYKHDMGTPEIVLMVETTELLKELDDMVLEARKASRKYKISNDPEDGIILTVARNKYRDRWEELARRKIPVRVYWMLFTII
jgi:hypothetical protein